MTRRWIIYAATALALYALATTLEPFRAYQLATAAAYFCAAAGLTVLTGLSGQLSLGHGAFMAIGAYTVALTQNGLADAGATGAWLLGISLLAAVLVNVVAGAVIGLAGARLHGPYLAGATLAIAVAVPSVPVIFRESLGGEQGLPVYAEPAPVDVPYERWQAWIAVTGALIVAAGLANLLRSRYGRELRAVRDDEVAARLAGVPVARVRVQAFVVSAAGAGLGGGLLAFLAQSVSPGAFPLTLSLFLLMAIVIGGLGSLAGAAWGAALLVVLPDLAHEITASLSLSPATEQRLAGNLPLAIFGLVLIVTMIVAPGGVQGALTRVVRRRRTTAPPS
ncbi:branched-chain amino acid ABC transporter permease [Luedemannella helvata]|uniref:Branched-chain amino acid ABC transporter permease n=1 Tax=Luedemannella helvata TaxID=349315 RepID=A0ABP4VY13_9ACTN